MRKQAIIGGVLALAFVSCFLAGLSLGLSITRLGGPGGVPAPTSIPSPSVQSSPSPSPPPTANPSPGRIQARVTRVIDGDTIEVEVEGRLFSVRYIGINAPEQGQPCGEEATDMNEELVGGQIVTLLKDVSEEDRYGRLLRYVYVGDLLVNAELVRRGYALAATYPPDVAYSELFVRLEREARAAAVGCWATPTVSPSPPSTAPPVEGEVMVDPACSQFDAPGNDNKNMGQEWVCFVNQGQHAVDLEGWRLEDEYGWSYTFPLFTLEAGAEVRVHTGCGQDTDSDLYWCREGYAVWNNDGDTVFLFDGQGALVSEYSY